MNRQDVINEIIKDLEKKCHLVANDELYALKENINFFNAIRSRFGYLHWLFYTMPKLDRKKLLELSDFGIPRWQKTLQKQLLQLEQKQPPDILQPLREELLKELGKLLNESSSEPVILVDVGCGHMEIERQYLKTLSSGNLKRPILIIGIDNSQASLDSAKKNLHSLGHSFKQVSIMTKDVLLNIIRDIKQVKSQVQIVVVKSDALKLGQYFDRNSVDLLYYSKFKHHLPDDAKKQFTSTICQVSKKVVEFDDYNGYYLLLLPLIFSWNKPVLFNGAVFSSLRDPTKNELHKNNEAGWKTKIFFSKGYIKKYFKND